MLLCILILCLLRLIGVQSLNVFLEDGYIESLDKEFFDVEETVVEIVAQNETFNTLFTDIVIIKDFPEDSIGYLTLWLKSNGEYNVPTGLTLSMPFCDMENDPLLMGALLRGMGFPEGICPPRLGRYGNPSYFPNLDLMPDSMPGSQYMITFVMKSGDKELADIRIYLSVF